MPLPRVQHLRLPAGALLAVACLAGPVCAPADASPADTSSAHTASPGADRDHTLQKQLDQLVHAPDGPPGVIAVLQRRKRSSVSGEATTR